MKTEMNDIIGKLKEIADEWQLKEILNIINKVEHEKHYITVGFLGEFSSGKSTLINAMLQLPILPAMERPTTKSITIVIPDNDIDKPGFFLAEDGEVKPIEPLDFQEIALGRREGKAIVKVKPSKFIPEGFMLVDTPGISSLNEMDTEVTFGYLPYIDGAVICQDISSGTFTRSLLRFLALPEVRLMIDKFIFVLTKRDRITQKDVDKILLESIQTLQRLFKDIKVSTKCNVEDRVVAISAVKALEGKEGEIDEFYETFHKNIVARKEEMLERRKALILKDIAEESIRALKDIKENIAYSSEDIDRQIKEIEDDIVLLHEQESDIKRNLNRLQNLIKKDIINILSNYKNDVLEISHRKSEGERIEYLIEVIARSIQSRCEKVLGYDNPEGIDKHALSVKIKGLEKEIEGLLSKVKIGELVATGVMFAFLGPLEGGANAAEFGAGSIMERLTEKLEMSSSAKVRRVINFIEQVNPISIAGEWVKSKLVSSKLEEAIPRIATEVSEVVRKEIEMEIEVEVFNKIKRELRNKRDAIKALKRRKIKEEADVINTRNHVESQMRVIKGLLDKLEKLVV